MYRSVRLLIVALALAIPSRLPAQSPEFALFPGERIWIAAPALQAELVPATVAHWEPGWVAFSLEDGQTWTRHMYLVDEVRVQRRVPLAGRIRSGMAWGVFLGTSVGGISAPFLAEGTGWEFGDWASVGISSSAGAAAGAAIGALVGAVLPSSSLRHYLFRAPAP